MPVKYLFIVLNSFLAGMVFISVLRKLSIRYKMLNLRGMPLIGGIAMGLSFIFTCLLSALFHIELSQQAKGIIAASFTMLIFGVIDDWQELSVSAKFVVQCVATTILVSLGVKTQIVGLGDIANIIITFLWVIGISNAFNHLDIIDGLAGGIALIVSLAFFVISFVNANVETALLALALSGTILAFLIYNFPPAKIYMGNSGSHFLGFILVAIAMAISYAPLERKVALLSPILILGFPIFDSAFLVLMRIKQKKSIFMKSNDHIALRLISSGYTKKKALAFMLILAFVFSLCGVLVSQVSNSLGLVIIIFVVLISLALTRKFSRISI